MDIIVFGSLKPDCKNCRRAETLVEKIIQGTDVVYRKLSLDSAEAKSFRVMGTPTIVVNDTIVALGEVPPADRLTEYIHGELEKEGSRP